MATIAFTKDLYFITTTVIDWMDVFTRPQYKHIVVDSLKYCQEHKGLDIYAWVLMTNHLHMIVSTRNGDTNVGDVMRDFKKFTSKNLVKAISENPQESRKEWLLDRCWFRGANDKKVSDFKFWQDGYYVEVIRSYDFYKQKLDYINMNPVKQEIVETPEHYLFSSARNYYGGKGLIDVILQP
ncbi:MAG: transposase [Prevotella sp.]|nr:transposase [Prevotella sp.]